MSNNETDAELEKAEEELFSTDDSNESPPIDIVSFNELRSCADLFRLHQSGKLNVQPEYQRDVVWNPASQTRFIDSLTKQLPIPSMCISLDYKTDQREVVDGLQRMSSIVRFLSDNSWRLSKLEDIDKKISNKKVEHIKEEHPEIFARIENTTIPVTVLRCDLSKRSHQEYLFTIFHRLNTGSVKLTNQEIRNCIYHGPFNKMLKEIVSDKTFVNLFDISEKKKYRFSNEELILRVMALAANLESYKPSLAKFLNAFMSKHRHANEETVEKSKNAFDRIFSLVYERMLGAQPLPRLSKATTEALLVGVFRNLTLLENADDKELRSKFQNLRQDPLFSVDALKEGLSATDKVKNRLYRSIEIFSE